MKLLTQKQTVKMKAVISRAKEVLADLGKAAGQAMRS